MGDQVPWPDGVPTVMYGNGWVVGRSRAGLVAVMAVVAVASWTGARAQGEVRARGRPIPQIEDPTDIEDGAGGGGGESPGGDVQADPAESHVSLLVGAAVVRVGEPVDFWPTVVSEYPVLSHRWRLSNQVIEGVGIPEKRSFVFQEPGEVLVVLEVTDSRGATIKSEVRFVEVLADPRELGDLCGTGVALWCGLTGMLLFGGRVRVGRSTRFPAGRG